MDGGGTVGLGVMVGGWVAGRIQRMKTWQLEETRQETREKRLLGGRIKSQVR